MALLFIITVLSLTGTLVDSASNITSCDTPLSNTTCTQGSCQQPPCTMHCGLMTSYEQCLQTCNSSCDSVKCDASIRCNQRCEGNCTSMTCDSQNCFQICDRGICGVMTCAVNDKIATNDKSVTYCEQSSVTAQMICEMEFCYQSCPHGSKCVMTCSSNVKECTQNCPDSGCRSKCDAKKCTYTMSGGSYTGINYIKPVHPVKIITCTAGCHSDCDAEQCKLHCPGGGCNMNCPRNLQMCNQTCTGGGCHSKCDANKCTLGCTGGACNMTCSSGVKECNLTCNGGGCHFQCDAKKCNLHCPGGACTTERPTSFPEFKTPAISSSSTLHAGASVVSLLMLLLML